MSLEDRDWFREEPSEAWKNLWGTEAKPSDAARRRRKRRYLRHAQRLAAVVGVAAVAMWGWEHRGEVASMAGDGLSKIGSFNKGSEPRLSSPFEIANNPKVVRLSNQPGLDVPATAVTLWTLDGPRFGHIEVMVPVGTTPREALTVALAERGFQAVG